MRGGWMWMWDVDAAKYSTSRWISLCHLAASKRRLVRVAFRTNRRAERQTLRFVTQYHRRDRSIAFPCVADLSREIRKRHAFAPVPFVGIHTGLLAFELVICPTTCSPFASCTFGSTIKTCQQWRPRTLHLCSPNV